MRLTTAASNQHRIHLRLWRRGWWLAFLLMLCSCRSVPQGQKPVPPTEATLQNRAITASVAQAVESVARVPIEQVVDQGLPIPITTVSPWTPPGIAGPWPHDEYLQDGGDREVQANIGSEGEVRGLELEDTVAVYDTVDGRTLIEPSNRVCLYSPRFAAVRKVTSVLQNEQREQLIGVELPVKASLHQEERLATSAVQPIQPEGEIATRQLSISRVGEGAIGAISRQPIAAMAGGFALHENFKVIRQGTFEESEKARLMEMVDAAITWSHDKAVQVVLNGTQAVDVTGDQRVQATYRVEEPDHPCLRVIKVASTKTAKPGDTIDFTIRFDNLGDQVINHVALVDNLTTRLEYVQGSAQSSREADFSTERNEGDSLVLRWDFADPLEVGGGGLVRFHCRVR
jgi:uncharacterized repeat protein (TIGR01451 family)